MSIKFFEQACKSISRKLPDGVDIYYRRYVNESYAPHEVTYEINRDVSGTFTLTVEQFKSMDSMMEFSRRVIESYEMQRG